jgi:hypothetical protein
MQLLVDETIEDNIRVLTEKKEYDLLINYSKQLPTAFFEDDRDSIALFSVDLLIGAIAGSEVSELLSKKTLYKTDSYYILSEYVKSIFKENDKVYGLYRVYKYAR